MTNSPQSCSADIVERMRNHVNNRGGASLQNGAWQMMLDAASEIDHLRAERHELTRQGEYLTGTPAQPAPEQWDFCKRGKKWGIYPKSAVSDGIDWFIADADSKADAEKIVAALNSYPKPPAAAQSRLSAGSEDDLREEVSYAIYDMKTTDGATDAIMKLIADQPQRERMWCRSCGTVTTSGNCDCTETGTGTQNLVNYADGLAEDVRELAQEIARLRAVPQAAPELRLAASRLADIITMLDAPDAYNREYIAAVCRSVLSSLSRPVLCAHGVKIGNTCVGCMGAASLPSHQRSGAAGE